MSGMFGLENLFDEKDMYPYLFIVRCLADTYRVFRKRRPISQILKVDISIIEFLYHRRVYQENLFNFKNGRL